MMAPSKLHEIELPKDWKLVKINDIHLKENDSILPQDFPDETFEHYSIPAFQDNNKKPVLTIGAEIKSNKISVNQDDVIYGKLNPKKSKVWLINSGSDLRKISSTEFLPITLNQNVISPLFIYQYLQLDSFTNKMIDLAAGSTNSHQRVTPSSFYNSVIAIPPLPEQQKIAEILSTVDEKIEVIEERITLTQELKKGLMQQLLTKGIGHTEFKDSPLGEIPVSWEVVQLDSVCEVLDPHPSHRAPKEDSNGFPFVGIGDISENGDIDLSKVRKISFEDVEKQKTTFLLEEGDMGFGRVASIGKVVWFKTQEYPYAISPTMALIRPMEVNPLFCYQYLSSGITKDQFRMLSVGSTRTSIGMKSLRTLFFLLPDDAEQQRIAEILSSVDDKLDVLSTKKKNYQELKKGLMQQLLTGKVRVNHLIEKEVSA